VSAPEIVPADLTQVPVAASLPTRAPSRATAIVVALAKWFAAIVGLMLLPQILFVAWLVIAAGGRMPPMAELIPPWWLYAASAVPTLLLIRHAWWADLRRLASTPWSTLLWLLLPLAVTQCIAWLGMSWFGAEPEQMMVELGESMARQPDWSLLVAIVLFAPILEEAIFRGLAWRWLRPACGRWATIGLTSLAFVGMHVGQYGAFGLSLVGAMALAFAAMRERTGSLLLCIAAHVLLNAVAMAGAIPA
jgi:membrane protease YdiL (CAAX protease family)